MIDCIRTLLHVFSTFAVGGPQMRFVHFASHFGPKYRHRIVAMDGATAAFDRLPSGVDAKLLHVPNRRGKTPLNVNTFRRVLREVQPDVLVTSNWGTIEWALANIGCRIPHLHMEDGFGPDEVSHQFARRVWARKLLLRHSTTVVPSLTLLAIARDLWRLPRRRIVHIANGVDLLRFRISPDPNLLAKFGIAKTLPLIGAVAPLRPEKNLRRLIDAFAVLRRERIAQLVIVGDGPERANLQAQAVERGVGGDVVFTGFCASPEKLLPAFSIVAVSSDTEQMPLSVLEAMAAGRPVAATGVGDIRYMLAEENHPFVVEKNAVQLACAILRLLDDPARAANVGEANARRAAEFFDQRRMFAAYSALFDQSSTGAAVQPQQLAN